MTVNFQQKIRPDRPFNTQTNGDLMRQFESDRGRIINSAAVRRLQQKTQVFPLERNAAVRSRLTHSLEVQQVGRYISQLVADKLSHLPSHDKFDRCLESLVEMACLMHDIGNPPFGHFGEQALSDWLSEKVPDIYREHHHGTLSDEVQRDLCHFEGNAQGIRLIYTLQKLNLTYSQVSGILKYTRCGTEPRPDNNTPFSYLKKKVGYFLSEQAYIHTLQETLVIAPGCRAPFSYIMEAADDISYGIADLEDAVEKGVLSLVDLKAALQTTFAQLTQASEEHGANTMATMLDNVEKRSHGSDSQFFVFLRVEVNQRLPRHAANRFVEHLPAVFDGTFNHALIEDNSVNHLIVQTFKNVAKAHAFCHPEVERRELQGYRVIHGLMSIYQPLLTLPSEVFTALVNGESVKQHASIYTQRLFKKLPEKHKKAYRDAVQKQALAEQIPSPTAREFYFRTRLLIDYISGMTDQYAFDEYRAFHVIAEG
ncbi:dGTPase [Salinivibrio sp. ES.052]|uniref:dGTPase n=1 Tax=Salinivibrio sp. ES.052 TaxID=1882823 RepID=UPI00092BCA3A|nr:dGTPase [Salinivibrio sp. ES.052]SIN73253.1 dGTPase [Salinivibrio sp. ES.052]